MEFTLAQVAGLLGGTLEGDPAATVAGLGKIEEALPGQIAFLSNPKYEHFVYETQATAVIVAQDFSPKKSVASALIRVSDPYSSFTMLLEEYSRMVSLQLVGVEEPAFLGEGAVVGGGHYRGAFSYIGKDCQIGENVKIYPQVYIGPNVKIGDNTVLYPGAKVYADTVIGSHCTIHAGAVIGSDGFGFAPQEDGSYKTIPQLGNVILEDHVSIGSNTVIDCATMGSTVVRRGVKLDNLIQIAHNVEIGENTVMAAQAGISGSTKVGKQCVFGGQVGIGGHIEIADNTTLGAKVGLIGKVRKSGQVLLGQPGFDAKDYMKSYAVFKRLPEVLERIEGLERKIPQGR